MDCIELDHSKVLQLLPDRNAWSHKGNYGRILLLCGSRNYTGAAAMAAMAALRSGAGLVYLGVPESIHAIEASKLTEPVILPLPDEGGMLSASSVEKIRALLVDMDAVLIGPGLGQSEGTLAVLIAVLQECKCPVVVDADGINLLASHKDILRGRDFVTILTPHEGEYRRIMGDVGQNRMDAAVRLALKFRGIAVLKGHETVITDGDRRYLNRTGNPGMATGGSGDVLAGIITALLGQGLPPLEAAAAGVWLHGAAGDICAGEIGQYGMLPTDMIKVLPRLLK